MCLDWVQRDSNERVDENTFINITKNWGDLLDLDDVTPSMIIFDKATMLIATAKPEFIHDKDVLNVNGVNYNIIAHEVDEPPAIRRGKSCHNNANGEGY